MELGFWNLSVTMMRRGRRLLSSGEGSLRERARRGDSSRNLETVREMFQREPNHNHNHKSLKH